MNWDGLFEGLKDDAVAFGELEKFLALFLREVTLEIESQVDFGQTDGGESIDGEGTAKVHGPFGDNLCREKRESHRRGDSGEGNSGASDKGF